MANPSLYSAKKVSRRVFPVNHFIAGITRYDKGGDQSGAFAFSRGADIHNNPREIKILPAAVKESGSTTAALPVWGEHVFSNVFFLDNQGGIYQRNYAGGHNLIHTAPNSRGNGIAYYGEDFFLYYINNTNIGRYGPLFDDSQVWETWAQGIDLSLWNNWGGAKVTAANKILTIASSTAAAFYGIEKAGFDLTGSFVACQLLDVGSRSLSTWLVSPVVCGPDGANFVNWSIDASNNLKAKKTIAGALTVIATTTYDATVHRYFRIRESAGTIYFDYSSDYRTWTNFTSTANPFTITSINAGINSGTTGVEVSTTSAKFGFFVTGVTVDTPQFVDDYFGSQGGVPQNTAQLNLVAASSQYGTHADQAAFQITSDIAMEIYFTPTSLPAIGSSMTLMGKWDESAAKRAYKFDLYAVSGYFGDGSDGALTISTNTTNAPIDSACTGTVGSTNLTATNASFAVGQVILIHQTAANAGTVGTWMRNKIAGYTAGTITLETPLNASYVTGAQVLVMKQYTTVTVNTGITWTAKAWNGTTGGILAFLANGLVTITGSISGNACGFRAGTYGSNASGQQGEGIYGTGNTSSGSNITGGGAGQGGVYFGGGGGGGGGNGIAGFPAGTGGLSGTGGQGGVLYGTPDLNTMVLGGGGGGAGSYYGGAVAGNGGRGGGIIFVTAATLTVTGSIVSAGANGTAASAGDAGGGGAGAGGSILLKMQSATLGAALITAPGGSGGGFFGSGSTGGNGAYGRIHLDYYVTYSGTTSPTLDVVQDNTLVTNTTYQLRFGVSNNGTALEYLTKNVDVPIGAAQRLGVSWKASESKATFYVAGNNVGFSVGTKTAIGNTTGAFTIGGNNGGAGITNFVNGVVDDARLWNTIRTDDQMALYNNTELVGNEYGLAFYAKFNSTPNDATSTANNLTLNGGPTYNTTVAFPSPTTRLDIDQSHTAVTAGTYAVPTTLTEADKRSFVPGKDPQKSLAVDIAAKGAGDFTLVVHDGLNRTVATVTVPNAQLTTGFYEFIYSKVFRPVIGATYHFHIYSTAVAGTINYSGSDITTARYYTYYQFLLNDLFHPAYQIGNVLGIGNERYLAVQDAAGVYNNQRLRFPAGWHVRCITKWRNFYAIGCWRGSNITDFDQGIIFFWDGFSVTYNDFIDVPQGGVNAMAGLGDKLYFVAGYSGKIMVYDGSTEPKQVRQIPNIDRTSTIEVLPGSMTVWQNMVRIGVAYTSNSTVVQRGIYTLGHNFSDEPESLTMDYVLSTGVYDNTMKIGALVAANTNLLVGWATTGVYGVDAIDPKGNPAAAATIEANIVDMGARWKEKLALVARVDFKPLKTGESVNIKYRFGYDQAWISGDLTVQLAGDTNIRLPIANNTGNHHEFQLAVDMAQTNNTSPVVLEYGMYEDLLLTEEENQY